MPCKRLSHCRRGHKFNRANTRFYVNAAGYELRVCRTCNKLRQAAYRVGESLPAPKRLLKR